MLSKLMRLYNEMQRIFIILSLSSLLFIGGCSSYHFPGVYRLTIEQGNIIDKDKLSQLKVGMTHRQVTFLMGPPMIQDTFNQDRWDYMYSLRTGKGKLIRERITLTFKGDILDNIAHKEYATIKVKN